jgi:adenylate kinase
VTFLVLLGAPGAGKGTQAAILAERLAIPHIATGDLFRSAVRVGSAIGLEARRYMERGQLVPDVITVRMLLDRLTAPDAAAGVILDGFPRTKGQAEALDVALAEHGGRVDHAVEIVVPAEELVRRMSGRWICAENGHVYHETSHPPRVPGRCDLDLSPLIQRADDRPDTIRERLAVQLGALHEVSEHYRQGGVLQTVDGEQDAEAVADAILAAIQPANLAGPVARGDA